MFLTSRFIHSENFRALNAMAVPTFALTFIFTVLFYLVFPVILLLFLVPNFLFRAVVQVTKIFMRKKLGNIVDPLSNLFAVDKLYSNPTSTLILGSVYEGIISRDFVCQLISEKWLEKRDSWGFRYYPELRQGLVSWFGYTFWQNDPSFHIHNHVKNLDENLRYFKREELKELFVKIANEPFKKQQSPWEILIIPHYIDYSSAVSVPEKQLTLILFKVHHALLDGFSMLNLGQNDLGNGTSLRSNQQDFSFRMKCAAILRIPYFAAKYFLTVTPLIWNHANDSLNVLQNENLISFFTLQQTCLNKIKQAKYKYNVSLTSIFLAGYTAAIRYFLLKRGNDLQIEGYQPSVMLPVPLPKHPEKLGNHMSFVSMKLPVYEQDSYQRLLKIHETLESKRKSLNPLCMYYALSCIGSLPSMVVKLFMRKSPISLLMSNFPGLSLPLTISGHHCTDIFFNGGLLQGNIHMICSCIGYNDVVALTVSMCRSLITSEADAEEFAMEIIKELNFLSS